MKLPFLKQRRLPRVATEPMDDKLVHGSPDDHLEAHCTEELMEACKSRDVKKFRGALHALIMNLFDWDEQHEQE